MVETLPAKATPAAAVESALIVGDLSKLTETQRLDYYRQVCASLGLNPLTRPLEYISLKGRLTLYARKDCTDQLRQLRSVSIEKPDIQFQDDWIIVTVAARLPDGRTDSDLGVVSRKDMGGDFGNSLMKAITKAKRRVTLSICGLGLLDETEVETIPEAKHVAPVNLTPLAAPTTEPTVEEVYTERTRLWNQWLALTAKAERLGLEYAPLGNHVNIQQIKDAAAPLVARIKAFEAQQAAPA